MKSYLIFLTVLGFFHLGASQAQASRSIDIPLFQWTPPQAASCDYMIIQCSFTNNGTSSQTFSIRGISAEDNSVVPLNELYFNKIVVTDFSRKLAQHDSYNVYWMQLKTNSNGVKVPKMLTVTVAEDLGAIVGSCSYWSQLISQNQTLSGSTLVNGGRPF